MVGAQHLQVLLGAAEDVVARGAAAEVGLVVDVAGEDDLVSLALQGDTELLALVVVVGVEEVDALVNGPLDNGVAQVLGLGALLFVAGPVVVAAQGDLGDLQARLAEGPVAHPPTLRLGGREVAGGCGAQGGGGCAEEVASGWGHGGGSGAAEAAVPSRVTVHERLRVVKGATGRGG